MGVKPMAFSETLRSMFERSVLLMVKTQSVAAAQSLMRFCAGLSVSATDPRARTFWHVAAAYFRRHRVHADAHRCLRQARRIRVLLQFNALMGKPGNAGATPAPVGQVSETLLRDLLFFCALAKDAHQKPRPLPTWPGCARPLA